MARMTGAQLIVRCLEREQVEYVFGMPGHANLALLDALADSSVRFISVPHEQLAAHMADAYFRVRHRPAVVLTSVGPGFTNAVTGIADAMHDCSAVVMLSGNVPLAHRGTEAYQEIAFHQDASQIDVLRPVVKRAWRVDHSRLLADVLLRAFNVALGGCPGPVLVDVPMDVFSIVEDFEEIDTVARRAVPQRSAAHVEDIQKAVDLLRGAQRPVVFAGGGVLLSEASDALAAVAERLQIPVITSLIAQSCVRNDHPLYGGVTGAVGTPTAHFLASQADVVLAIGSRFSDMDCSSWRRDSFFKVPPAKVVQVDIDPSQVGRRFPVEVGVVGDAKTVLEQILSATEGYGGARGNREWLGRFEEWRSRWRAEIGLAQRSDEVPIAVERVIAEIRAALPADGILVAPNGARYFVAQHFPVLKPACHVVASGHGTMGFAVPAALGAKLGRPKCQVMCLTGDGGFRSTSSALAVAVESNIPVVWVILNNAGYNIIELYQNRFFQRQVGAAFVTRDGKRYNPDFVALARAYGAEGERVERPEDIAPSLARALGSGAPYVVDVLTTPRPKIRASGFWEANRYLKLGWNEIEDGEFARGFGDSAQS